MLLVLAITGRLLHNYDSQVYDVAPYGIEAYLGYLYNLTKH